MKLRTLQGVVRIMSLVPVTILNPVWTATDFQFSFATGTGCSYVVQATPTLPSPNWTNVTTVPGTGGTVTVTNALQSSDQYFYRVVTQCP